MATRYPELTVTKLRFLEDEGLIAPERTSGGYRKFSKSDLERITIILRLQKEHFYPLNVIREKLVGYDNGIVPAELNDEPLAQSDGLPLAQDGEGKLSLREAGARLGIPESFINELAEYNVIDIYQHTQGRYLAHADIAVVKSAWALHSYGVDPRHLKMFVNFSQRESEFFGQLLIPTYRHKTPESRELLKESLTDIAQELDKLKGYLTRRALVDEMQDYI